MAPVVAAAIADLDAIVVNATGQSGRDFALSLLENSGVATMPGESFGTALGGWIRVALTQDDSLIATACDRIAAHVSRGQAA